MGEKAAIMSMSMNEYEYQTVAQTQVHNDDVPRADVWNVSRQMHNTLMLVI